MNHLIITNIRGCRGPQHGTVGAIKQKEADFTIIIKLHLKEQGCLQFQPDVCLDVYNIPIKLEIQRVTQFNQYSSDCDSDSLIKPLCDYGNGECFSADRICTFERDIYGDPVHCSDTEHLRYCASHQCPDAFKCNGSYCIPVHMVCDTILDCPDGEDEAGCDELVARGMFRYGSLNLSVIFDLYHSFWKLIQIL